MSLLLMPPLFDRIFSLEPLYPEDVASLWIYSVVMLLCSCFVGLNQARFRNQLSAVFLSVLAVHAAELAVRLLVVNGPSVVMSGAGAGEPIYSRENLIHLAARSYPRLMNSRSHPFLQFVGNPQASRNLNNLGYNARRDYVHKKLRGTVRVACLGGSTTESGYPRLLEDDLNKRWNGKKRTFEALNFGHGFYNSAHATVNFILNVVEFSPDYVVLHLGWNDEVIRDSMARARGDYSHVLSPFKEPVIPDKYLIRASVTYRYLLQRLAGDPRWLSLGLANVHDRGKKPGPRYGDIGELRFFRQNIETIVDLALLRGITPVLTTQPHSTDSKQSDFATCRHLKQSNSIIKDVAAVRGQKTLFVDLDGMMTGAMNHHFTDLAHVDSRGRAFKAEKIGDAILEHLRRK